MKMLAFLLAAALLPPMQEAPRSERASNTFHDAATGISFRYPAEFEQNDRLAANLQTAASADRSGSGPDRARESKCMFFPLTATLSKPHQFGMLLIIRVDGACMGEPETADRLGVITQGMMQMMKPYGRPITEDALDYKLDGHPASFVQGTAEARNLGPDTFLHAASVCTLVGSNTLCWMMLDTRYKAMPGLVAGAITFDGHTDFPLVPKEIVKPW